ncbi:MAG TPA: hypothetical protein VKT49_19255, partial [Bryobacteraceae bacterium]|nr:hypothetical protein [Bryobacteraceae bacterium]
MNRSICTFTLAVAGSLIPGAGAQHRAAPQAGDSQFAADRLEKRMADNPNLASRVQVLLPPGT